MLRRPPSYSDSFLILPGGTGLTPLVLPVATGVAGDAEPVEVPQPQPKLQRITVFLFQGSLHVLFISAFETAFYFLYVSKSENQGILNAIDTYYDPFVANCRTRWGNGTRWFIGALLHHELNQTEIDAGGAAAAAARTNYNQQLLIWSAMYSVICAVIAAAAAGVSKWRGWTVPWKGLITETLAFVALLGLYEIFFFKTIIYNYDTITTPELDQYLVDGLAECVARMR